MNMGFLAREAQGVVEETAKHVRRGSQGLRSCQIRTNRFFGIYLVAGLFLVFLH